MVVDACSFGESVHDPGSGVAVHPASGAGPQQPPGGAFGGGITESMLAGGVAADNGWWVEPMPEELARYNLVFGLWKGDLTLKREVDRAFRQLEAEGTLAAILARYGAVPIGPDGLAPGP